MGNFNSGLGASFSQSCTKHCSRRSIKTILRDLQDVESNYFEGIAMGDESWFRYCYPSSTMFAWAPAEVIPRTRQTIGSKNTIITIFFTAHQLILLDVRPKGSKFNQQYFINYVFPDLEMENRNFRRQMPLAIV
jgi:hypothetical protein